MEKKYFIKTFLTTCFIAILFCFSSYAQVGIGNTNPTTQLDIDGAISLREGGVLTLVNGNNNNVNLGATPYSFYRITGPTAAFNIRTIIPSTNADGQIVILENTTNNTMTLRHNNGGSSARRMYCPGGENLILVSQYATVTLMYNASQSRWIATDYSDTRYGSNIQSVKGTTDILIYSSIDTAPFVTMTDMTITFTPNHSTVYISFSSSGWISPVINTTAVTTNQTGVYFKLLHDATTVGHSTSVAGDYDFDDIFGDGILTGWNAHFTMFPITVTPGVSTTISVQWRSDTFLGNFSPSTVNPIVFCNPASDTFSHRSLTILD